MEKPANYRIDRNIKTVFVKFTGETSIEDLIEQEKMIIKDMRGRCKWAIYAPYIYAYAFSKMFALLARGLTIETKVFREEEKAKEWLGISNVT